MARNPGLEAAIRHAASRVGIPAHIALGVVRVESNFNPDARGGAGEIGLFQIMPRYHAGWARRLGFDINTVEGNIYAGLTLLSSLYRAEGSWTNALRRYNGGPAYSRKPVTATYAKRVLEAAGESRTVAWPVAGRKREVGGLKFNQPTKRAKSGRHRGVDIRGREGDVALAPVSGRVVFAGTAGPFGLSVVIEDDRGFRHRTAHHSALAVRRGQVVEAGDMIGRVGQTGNAHGAHVHYEVVSRTGKLVDPMEFLNGADVRDSRDVMTEDEPEDVETASQRFADSIARYVQASGLPVNTQAVSRAARILAGLDPVSGQPDPETGEILDDSRPTFGTLGGSEEGSAPFPLSPVSESSSFSALAGPLSVFAKMVNRRG